MKSKLPIIGVTGGIGSGKSYVATFLKNNGCVVADADANSKLVLQREEIKNELHSWWGDRILDASGKLQVAAIASIVFSDPVQRKRLENLIHPLVRTLQEEAFDAAPIGTFAFVIDAPLLLEAGLDADCDVIIFVDSTYSIRLQRVIEHRGWTEEQLLSREAAQIGLDKKRDSADHIIINDGDVGQLDQQTRSILLLIRNSIGNGE